MGYQIQYTPIYKKTIVGKRMRYQIPAVILSLVILAAGIAHRFPEKTESIIQAFFPLSRAESKAAIDVFCDRLSDGETLSDSIVAFCREIINDTAPD